jgi:predicted RNA-binding Zn-ribbon protein involved in translation (DUF1610 family)
MTDFIIEHQCPQCGAPAELAETDRLFRCGFCRVASYLTTPDLFRYVLPHKVKTGQEIFYYPYWRFKGMSVACLPHKIESRIVDFSQRALDGADFPPSVGFRGQTQKLRFASALAGGRFLKPQSSQTDFVSSLEPRLTENLPRPILHQVCIAETVSLLYAPFYLDTQLIDALIDRPVPGIRSESVEPLLACAETPNWPIRFIAAICPHCGQDLKGERDALALSCANCSTLWRAEGERLGAMECFHVAGTERTAIHLPFWRIEAEVSSISLTTLADLVRVGNLPKVVQPSWEERPFYFWSPAFKVRPQNLLNIGSHLTLNQPADDLAPGPPDGAVQSVNLPLTEAMDSLKPILAGFMRPRERMVELLPKIDIRLRRAAVVFLAFSQTRHEWVHDGLRLAVNKNTIGHARNL